MASAENVAIIIYSCNFQIVVKQVSFVAKFPCEVLVEWKQTFKAQPIRSSKHQVINNQAIVDESLFAQAEVIFIQQKSEFFKKETSLEVKWISISRPEFEKPIGKVVIDIAQLISDNPFSNTQRHRLVHSPVKGVQIQFAINLIDKKVISKSIQDIDRYYLNQFYAKYPRRKIEIAKIDTNSIENSSVMSFSPRNTNNNMNLFSKQIPQNINLAMKTHNPAAFKRLNSNLDGVQQKKSKIQQGQQQYRQTLQMLLPPQISHKVDTRRDQQEEFQSSLIADTQFYLASQRILPNFRRLESPNRIPEHKDENSDFGSQSNVVISQCELNENEGDSRKEQQWKNRQNQLKKQIENLTSLWNEHQAEKRANQLQAELQQKQVELQNCRSWQQQNLHLKYELSEIKQQIQKSRAAIDEKTAMLQFKQVEVKAVRQDFETLKQQKEELEQQITQIRKGDDVLTKLNQAEQQNKQLNKKIEQLFELNGRNDEIIKQLRQEKRILENMYAEKNVQSQQKSKRIVQITQQKDKQTAQLKAAYLQAQKQLLQSKVSIKDSIEAVGLLEEEKLQMEQEMQDLIRKMRETDSTLHSQIQKGKLCQNQIKILSKIIEQKSQMLEKANKAINQFQQRIQQLEKNAVKFLQQNQVFKAKQQRFFQKEEKMKVNLAILEVESKKIFELMQEKQENQFVMQTQIKALKSQLLEYSQRAEILQSQCQNYEQHLNILSEENGRLCRQQKKNGQQFSSQNEDKKLQYLLEKQREKVLKVTDQLNYLKRMFEISLRQGNLKCQELSTALHKQINQIQTSKEQLAQENRRLKQQIKEKNSREREIQLQLKKAENQNRRFEEWKNRTEKQILNSSHSNNQINSLKLLLSDKQNLINQLEDKAEAKQKQLLQKWDKQENKLIRQIQTYRKKVGQIMEQVQILKKEQAQKIDLVKQKDTRIKQLEQKILNLNRRFNKNLILQDLKPRSPIIGVSIANSNSKQNEQLIKQIEVLRYCLQENQKKMDQVLDENQILKKEVEDLVNRKVATKPAMPFLEISQIRKTQIQRMNSCQLTLRQRTQHDLYIIYHQLKRLLEQRDKKQEVSSVIHMLKGNFDLSEKRLERHTLQNCQVQEKARQANLKLQQFKREFMKSKASAIEKAKLVKEIRPLQNAIDELSMISQKMFDNFVAEKDQNQEDS